MSWTKPFDGSKLFNDDAGICIAYSAEACFIAATKGIDYCVDPNTYVDKYFGGVQPTGAEFLNFLHSLGFDSVAIFDSVAKAFQRISQQKIKASRNAEIFFNLFQTEWHVENEQILKYIDEHSIYYLLELAVTNAASTRARLAATKRHAETRNIKADVFEWLDLNMHHFKSMDAAAHAVTKQQPIAFRTARDWVGEWKKLRSASKP